MAVLAALVALASCGTTPGDDPQSSGHLVEGPAPSGPAHAHSPATLIDEVPYCTVDDLSVEVEVLGASSGGPGEAVDAAFVITHVGENACHLDSSYSLMVIDDSEEEVLTFGASGSCDEVGCFVMDSGDVRTPRFSWDRTAREFDDKGEAHIVPAPPGFYRGQFAVAVGHAEGDDEGPVRETMFTFDFATVGVESK